jgi:hypothetical protein
MNLPTGFETAEQFIGHMENRAFCDDVNFTAPEVAALIALAHYSLDNLEESMPNFPTVQEGIMHMCMRSRFYIAKAKKQAGERFDDTAFRHLRVVNG